MPLQHIRLGRALTIFAGIIASLVAITFVVIVVDLRSAATVANCRYNPDEAILTALRSEADRNREIASHRPTADQIEAFKNDHPDCCKMLDRNPLEPNKKREYEIPAKYESHFVRLIYQLNSAYYRNRPGEDGYVESIVRIDWCNKPLLLNRIFNPTPEPVISREQNVTPAEGVTKTVDGQNQIQLNGLTILLPDEPDPKYPRVYFWIGADELPITFSFIDLMHDTNRYAVLLRTVPESWVTANRTFYHDRLKPALDGGDILGTPVARGVGSVIVGVGLENDCDQYSSDRKRLREAALTGSLDQYGWFRLDYKKSPRASHFLKFLDPENRPASRFQVLTCNYLGSCQISACNNGIYASIKINSVNKIKTNDDYSIAEFDDQIASGKRAIENIVENQPVDLSLPAVF